MHRKHQVKNMEDSQETVDESEFFSSQYMKRSDGKRESEQEEQEGEQLEQTEEEEEGEEQVFYCRFEKNKLLIELLVGLSLDTYKDFECYVEATPEVLMFSVIGKGKSTQSRITFPSELFEEYSCSHETIYFVVKLNSLLDCLRLFGVEETITTSISYSSEESLVKISLEESGILTIGEITCLYVEEFEELQQSLIRSFRSTEEECQIIIKSDALKDCLHGNAMLCSLNSLRDVYCLQIIVEIIDSPWVESINIEVNNLPQYFKISTTGGIGDNEILIPRVSDAYVSFNCVNPISASYHLKSLLLGMKALNLGKETYLRINSEGIMCLQHQIETVKGENVYYDFIVIPEQPADH